jgi:putative hydrolase of the HAD superfamily
MHWLFDFDLTLYGHDEYAVLQSLDRNITRFLMVQFQLSEPAADALRHDYWKNYGTTLNGLRALQGTRPEEYFDFIHSGEQLIVPRLVPAKRAVLLGLPGKKWVFTNARRDWAERGICAMGLAECFEGLFDIEYFGWNCKPDPVVYAEVELRLGCNPVELVLLDDRPANLVTARTRGWRTVFVHPEIDPQAVECDLQIATILDLETTWPLLQKT